MVVTAKICAVHDDSLMQEAVIGLLLCLAGLELQTPLIAHLHCPDTRESERHAIKNEYTTGLLEMYLCSQKFCFIALRCHCDSP